MPERSSGTARDAPPTRPGRRAVVALSNRERQVASAISTDSSRAQAMTTTTDSPHSAERALLARIIAGDERALGELFDCHGGLAFSLASAIVSDPSDAEDVVADAFAQVWRSAATSGAVRGNVRAWLTAIVRSRSLDFIGSRRRRPRAFDRAVTLSVGAETPVASNSVTSAGHLIELSETRTAVCHSLASLPHIQRTVLELAYFDGLSRTEIADRLLETSGTVRTRLRAGMEKLRQRLRPLADSFS